MPEQLDDSFNFDAEDDEPDDPGELVDLLMSLGASAADAQYATDNMYKNNDVTFV